MSVTKSKMTLNSKHRTNRKKGKQRKTEKLSFLEE